jgi:hypothetical protein
VPRVLAVVLAVAACSYSPPGVAVDAPRADGPWFDDAGLPYCWIFECPTDLGATVCGSCSEPNQHLQCPPGFLCSCERECVKGPNSYDGAPGCMPDAAIDAGAGPDARPVPDARLYDWPTCNEHHLPGAGSARLVDVAGRQLDGGEKPTLAAAGVEPDA